MKAVPTVSARHAYRILARYLMFRLTTSLTICRSHYARRVSRGIDSVELGEEQVRDPMARRETLELVRTYYSIKTPLVRKLVADMVKSIATTLAGD